ncbi:uncharacterized protein MKK02DRAFT_45711 [Dioszegia hungarica]|uniref:Uncharacterized protein n=1 Tax=Dioszegia hungarica TaxID=4972 RepID=A0AA38HDU2_9TREE|nr:uncharacterized protein MKK02DRAFT_45711 [Dioszegia hungarica]KAI9637001.1 hypothetical protein MKK02DRAFT_45711 [Dioszegia hungarica]
MPAVLSDDALNRYRITHPDKELRTLLRRIYLLPGLAAATPTNDEGIMQGGTPEGGEVDAEMEREITRIEVLKWKASVERVMASAKNLGRQGERYRQRAEETSRQAEALEATLEDEKRLLASKLKERDHMIRCDAVYAKITARPKSKEELKEQIVTLQAQIEAHRTSHATYLDIVQRRIDAFSSITPIVDEVKAMELPVETSTDTTDEPMDVDDPMPASREPEPAAPASDSARLSGSALPFQPSSSASSSRSNAATPPSAPSARSASHALPTRPSRKSPVIPTAPSAVRGVAASGNRAASASLPQRPSGLRSSTTPGRNGLEEGEVEGEEGEVDDRKVNRGGRRR